MDRVEDTEVAEIVAGHLKFCEEKRAEWRWFRAAIRNEFWKTGNNPWSTSEWGTETRLDEELPFKMEVNLCRPFLDQFTSNLFLRNPRSTIEAPRVQPSKKAGRPKKLQPEAVAAYCDDFLTRSEIQAVTKAAYRMALCYDAAAFKLGWNAEAESDVVENLWVDAIPRWECGWDERVRDWNQQAFRFHLRWERADRVEGIAGEAPPPPEKWERQSIPDYLADGMGPQTPTAADATTSTWGGYVHLLEFYDLVANEQRFYLVRSAGSGTVTLQKIGDVAPIPYDHANGRPGVPIIPVVLYAEPEYPLAGMSALRPIYYINAERNFLLTVVANAMRRDAARAYLYLKGKVDEKALEQFRQGKDSALIGISAETLAGAIQALDAAPLGQSLATYQSWLMEAKREAQGVTPLRAGRAGKTPLSATEAHILAEVDEVTTSEIAESMQEAIGRLVELALVVTGHHISAPLEVTSAGETYKLSKAELIDVPWVVEVNDATTTPVKEAARRAEFQQAQPLMEKLLVVATQPTTDEAAAAQQAQAQGGRMVGAGDIPGGGGPVPIAPEVRLAARRQLDYLVQLYNLPEELSWSNIAASVEKPKAKRAASEPDEDKLSAEQAYAMLEEAVQAASAAPAGPAPVAPGVM